MINLELQFQLAAGELASELVKMHGTLLILLVELGKTELSPTQRALADKAYMELRRSQGKFFETYADQAGGAAPEKN